MSWRSGIHGYAAKWNVVTDVASRPHAPELARAARFERNCFAYDAASVGIWFMHRSSQRLGVGAELGLQIWPDHYGLAFAFTPPSSLAGVSMVSGISGRRYNNCSVGAEILDASLDYHGHVIFDNIRRARLNEISICPRGACPGAVCWSVEHPTAYLWPELRSIAEGHARGRPLW